MLNKYLLCKDFWHQMQQKMSEKKSLLINRRPSISSKKLLIWELFKISDSLAQSKIYWTGISGEGLSICIYNKCLWRISSRGEFAELCSKKITFYSRVRKHINTYEKREWHEHCTYFLSIGWSNNTFVCSTEIGIWQE